MGSWACRPGRMDTKAFVAITQLQHWWSCRARCSCREAGCLPYTCCATLACPCGHLSYPHAEQMSPGATHGQLKPLREIIRHFPEEGAPAGDRCGAAVCLRSWDAACPTVTWGRACWSKTPHGNRSVLISDMWFHRLQLFARMLSTWFKLSQGDIILRRDGGGRISIWATCCVLSHPANSHNSICKH